MSLVRIVGRSRFRAPPCVPDHIGPLAIVHNGPEPGVICRACGNFLGERDRMDFVRRQVAIYAMLTGLRLLEDRGNLP